MDQQQDDSESKQNDGLTNDTNEDGTKKDEIKQMLKEESSNSFEPEKRRRHIDPVPSASSSFASLSSSFEPEKKKRNVDLSSLPSDETCKELTALLKQVIAVHQSSTYCNDCDQNGERCNCRFSRSELLGSSLCFTDLCPACHHPICHHP